jgi:hypothetical protein
MNAKPELIEPRGNAVAMRAETAGALTPMDMLDRALSNNASIDVMEKLLTMQERWEAGQARKAFEAAIAEAKAEIPAIVRNKEGHNSKRYADFAAIAKVVDPILSRHGLSYRFRTEQTERINVTCILSHRDGHHEETTLAGPPDASGSKNAIQAIGSTLTYLQRYSLVQMLGLAAADDDDGKAGAAGGPISEEQVQRLQSLIVEVAADIPKFCKYMQVGKIDEIAAKDFPRALSALESKRAK